jgi:PIN domain nuclease of toxin-antitoxin system
VKLLLDTHTFIWWDSQPELLPPRVLALCHDPANQLYLSVASAWEMQIKLNLGKLTLRLSLADIIADQQANGIEVLTVTLEHVIALGTLPSPHHDPFDRLIIAQALVIGATIVSRDSMFAQYPAPVVW